MSKIVYVASKFQRERVENFLQTFVLIRLGWHSKMESINQLGGISMRKRTIHLVLNNLLSRIINTPEKKLQRRPRKKWL